MKAGKILYKGTAQTGEEIIIRYPIKDDLQQALKYINTLSKERTFIRFQGEAVTLEHEEKWLEGELKKIEENKAVQLFIFSGEDLIGISGINMQTGAEKHVGIFGISLAKEFRNKGLGKMLTNLCLKESGENLKDLKIIILGLFENNFIAKKMYEKIGFIEFGNLPKGLLRRCKYVDHIYMYKTVQSKTN